MTYRGNRTRVIVGSCVRQQQDTLHTFLRDLERMHRQHHDSMKAVLFENDSTDHTREMLTQWAEMHEFATLVLEDRMRGIRTERLSVCRNTLLHHALRSGFEFFVCMDSDYSKPIDVKVVLSLLMDTMPWTAQFGNTVPFHYDVWALRHARYQYRDVWRDGVISFFTHTPFGVTRDSDPVAVRSAFNGLGVYRLDRIQATKCRYKGRYADMYPLCEHVAFHECLLLEDPSRMFFIQPSMISTTRSGAAWTVPGVHWVWLALTVVCLAHTCLLCCRRRSRFSSRKSRNFLSRKDTGMKIGGVFLGYTRKPLLV